MLFEKSQNEQKKKYYKEERKLLMKDISSYLENGYCYSWETMLPAGFRLGPPVGLKRCLYYYDICIGKYMNNDALHYKILEMLDNPPICIIPEMIKRGQFNPDNVTDINLVKQLVKNKLVTYEYVYKHFPELHKWIERYRDSETVFNHQTYFKTDAGWVDSNGELIDNRKCHFKSTMEARLAYSVCKCTISDVAEYSWGAVFECIGDLSYKLIRAVRLSVAAAAYEDFRQLLINTKAKIITAEANIRGLRDHTFISDSIILPEDYIHELYEKVENEIPYNYLLTDNAKRIQVLKGELVIEGCEWISDYIKQVRKQILNELKALRPKHIGFTWNTFVQIYSPKYAAPVMSSRKEKLFNELLDKVLYGEMSGYEAHLRFIKGSMIAIKREHNRFSKYHTPYVAYYRERHEKLDSRKYSFTSAVLYVVKRTRELITLGMRRPQDRVTAFNYEEGRYNVDIDTYAVKYRGWKRGMFLKLTIPAMTQQELDEYMPDKSLHKCIIKKIHSFNRQQFMHKLKYNRHSYGDEFNRSIEAITNTLRPPTKFLKAIHRKALVEIAMFQRFKDTVLKPVAFAP